MRRFEPTTKQAEAIEDLKDRGEISIFDYPERVPEVCGGVRYGDIVIEPNGDVYRG